MSRARRFLASFRPGRRSESADGGFSLIEVIVALGLLVAVMATTAGFFTTSLKQSNGQTQAQEAAVLADQMLDYTRSVAAKPTNTGAAYLLTGRTSTAVAATIASPPIGVDLTQDVTASGNSDPSATGSSSQAVPITTTATVAGTKYTITTFIDQCYLTAASSPDCKSTVTSYGWLYRISVDVSYSLAGGRSCAANKPCYFVASALRDPGSDACFNVNVAFAGCSTSQPTITSFTPNTVTTNSTTTITVTGSNFDPGAKVDLDTGGTASSVTVNSSTSLTFTLTADNTPAAVGTRTVKVTNPNGKFAYGTMTITTSALTVTSVTPSLIFTSSTNTLTISGSGFQSGSLVAIPSSAGTIVGSPTITANTITLIFTAGSGTSAIGTWAATVTNPDGNTKAANFSIQKAPVTLTAISPSSMVWGSTRTFTLTGTAFDSGATVTLDGANVAEAVNSSTSITVSLTSDPSIGTRTFKVTNPDGGNVSKTFTVTVNPISFTTSPDPSSPGTKTFTLNGSGFLSGATVALDGTTLSSGVTRVSSSQITVMVVTAPVAGTHTFRVTNPDTGSANRQLHREPAYRHRVAVELHAQHHRAQDHADRHRLHHRRHHREGERLHDRGDDRLGQYDSGGFQVQVLNCLVVVHPPGGQLRWNPERHRHGDHIMSALAAARRRLSRTRDSDGGFTIIELLVSMILMAVISTTFLAAINAIFSGIHKQQGIVNAADGNRRAFLLLDKQVRYASAINTPGTAADGNYYVEYQWSKSTGSVDDVVCSQWRLNPTKDLLQYRSWPSGSTPTPTPAWTTVDTGVVNNPSTQPPFWLLGPTAQGATMQYQVLDVNFITKSDKGTVTTTGPTLKDGSVVGFTALNTPNAKAPSPAVCQEVARS